MGNCFQIPTNNAEWQLGYYPTVGQNIIQFSPSSQQCTYYQPTYLPNLPITQQPTLPVPIGAHTGRTSAYGGRDYEYSANLASTSR